MKDDDFHPDEFQYAAGEFLYDRCREYMKENAPLQASVMPAEYRALDPVTQRSWAFASIEFKRRYVCAG